MAEIINKFLNSEISIGTAILISVAVCMAYMICTILIVFCMDYYDKHKKGGL